MRTVVFRTLATLLALSLSDTFLRDRAAPGSPDRTARAEQQRLPRQGRPRNGESVEDLVTKAITAHGSVILELQ
jgi:hypothetical protein